MNVLVLKNTVDRWSADLSNVSISELMCCDLVMLFHLPCDLVLPVMFTYYPANFYR